MAIKVEEGGREKYRDQSERSKKEFSEVMKNVYYLILNEWWMHR